MKTRPGSVVVTLCLALLFSTFSGISVWSEEPAAPEAPPASDPSATVREPSSSPSESTPPEAPSQAPAEADPSEAMAGSLPAPVSIPPAEQEAETNTQFKPDVVITEAGSEYNIKVTYPHPMNFASQDALEYVRMESLPGEFLGLITYDDQSASPTAEFMINPALAGIKEFRLVAKSTKAGLIKTVHPLELSPVKIELPQEPPAAAQSVPEKPSGKKRFLGIF